MAVNDHRGPAHRSFATYGNVLLFALAVVLTAFFLTTIAHRELWRSRIDATKTRAYSLSEQTRQMLDSLDGSWRIVVMMVEAEADRTVRRQVDEVLDRFAAAAPDLTVARIDPTNPAALDAYESVLSDLRRIYGEEIAAYDTSLARAKAAFNDWLRFANVEAAAIQDLTRRLPDQLPIRAQIAQLQPFFTLMATNGNAILTEVDTALDVHESQPLPDYETARSILSASLMQSAQQLADVARILTALRAVPAVDRDLAVDADEARRRYEAMSQKLAQAGDPLRHLPPLELSRIGSQMQQGETAIVISPRGAAIIPSTQLFPKANIRAATNGVSFDQRFRGEQVIAASMRSLLVDRMPKVVFVHAGPESYLQESDSRVDLFGVKTLLETARLEVDEWIIGKGARPSADPGQTTVWVVVPTPLPARTSREPTPTETLLIGTVERLLTEGEPVLLSYYPSLMHDVRQPDPWQRLLSPWGLRPDTSAVVYESVLTDGGVRRLRAEQDVAAYNEAHPIGRAVDGLQTRLGFPLPVRASDDDSVGAEHTVLATIEPATSRWLEPAWARPNEVKPPQAGDARQFDQPVPIIVSAERPNPQNGAARQRLVVVGSGDWLQSRLADLAANIGGSRMALVSPGNIELLQSSVFWLAGLDELIAQSPTGQQVARLEGVTQADRLRWGIVLILAMPLGCLVLGGIVFVVRRF